MKCFWPHIFFSKNIFKKNVSAWCVLWILFLFVPSFSQTAPFEKIGADNDDKIWFSMIPIERRKSLEPYYEALKDAAYGTERFSIFEQLATAHMEKASADSIRHYGNLYIKELTNWDRPEAEKTSHYAKAYYFLAVGNQFNGLLDNAIEWHLKGIRAAEKCEHTGYQYQHKIGLGKVYNLIQRHKKAIEMLEKAIADFGEEWPKYTNEALIHLGDAYYSSDNSSKAKKYYEQAKKGSTAVEDLGKTLFLDLKLGEIAEREGKYDKAFTRYNGARERALAEGLNVLYFEGTIRVGELFYKEKNYEAATMALSMAYVNAMERDNLHYQEEILKIKSNVFADAGNHENAYAVMTRLAAVRKRISERQQQKISKELEVQYETLEKEKEILKLQEDQILKTTELARQKTYKNAFLIGFLIILVPIIALLFTYYQKIQAQSELSKKQEVINSQKVAALKKEQELNLIKAAIAGQDEERKRIAQELHDSIGGNLAGIKLQLASVDENSEQLGLIGGQLDETYQLVRDISHTLIPKKFRQNAFTQLIATYIKSIESTGKLKIGFHPHPEDEVNAVADKLQMELFNIIKELMTNTLKHAKAKQVDIHLSCIANTISLLFEDNGVGFEMGQKVAGIGFKNIKDRVREMNGTCHFDAAPGRGTVVSIEIPKI